MGIAKKIKRFMNFFKEEKKVAIIQSVPEQSLLSGKTALITGGTGGIGRAIAEKLLSAGFVERKGKSLVPTKDGINLAVILPDMLKSPLPTIWTISTATATKLSTQSSTVSSPATRPASWSAKSTATTTQNKENAR